MTKGKGAIFAFLLCFLVLAMHSASRAVNTAEINRVSKKAVLETEDFQIIDDFVAEAVKELVRTKDFTSVARIRSVILSRSSSGEESAQAQYSGQFLESAYKYISSAFEQASGLAPEDRKVKVMVNLLILVDGLQDLRFVDLASGMLNNEHTVVRYWAVHAITNAGITRQLNSTGAGNLQLAGRIVEQLKGLIGGFRPEVLALIAKFASELNIAEAEELLLEIADVRISQYADWTVEYELLDGAILKLLYGKINSAPVPAVTQRVQASVSKADIVRRFAQLYSYAIQRYVKGRDILNDRQKHQLASVLVETEKSCIGELLERPQSFIKKATEQDDVVGLLLEHSRLLGDETRAGQLPLKLNFDYGVTSDGTKRIAPLVLPNPPVTEATE